MSTLPPAVRYLRPYVRLFPIWRYGPRYIGARTEDGWYPDRYEDREIPRFEAEAIWAAEHA